jgi:RNA ligase partner protein
MPYSLAEGWEKTVMSREPLMRLVLDTSVFTNPDTARQFGPSVGEAFGKFLELADAVGERLRFFMPPSIYTELTNFLDEAVLPPRFEVLVSLRAPNRYGVQVPGFLLYELIDEIRMRIDRGLRVAESAVRDAQQDVDRRISRLRDKYRDALRAGLLDSREDVDLILLAHELEGAVVSSDHGVVQWAEKLGVRIIHPEQLRGILDDLLRQAGEAS